MIKTFRIQLCNAHTYNDFILNPSLLLDKLTEKKTVVQSLRLLGFSLFKYIQIAYI